MTSSPRQRSGDAAHSRMRFQIGSAITTVIGLALVLAIAGPWLTIVVSVVIGMWFVTGLMGHWFATPEEDAYYSALDEELDREAYYREIARRRRVWEAGQR